jgi:hypothetical protein
MASGRSRASGTVARASQPSRLNDTSAIIERGLSAGESHSISTRKIDNGYVTSVSTCNPTTGSYDHAEVFTANPPNISPPKLDGRQGASVDKPTSLKEAKEYLGGGPGYKTLR